VPAGEVVTFDYTSNSAGQFVVICTLHEDEGHKGRFRIFVRAG